jgi:cold shock CspA family protein
MRFDGTLKEWSEDRGVGLITPQHGGAPIFVHVSAFPRDTRRLKLGERVSFEIESDADGTKRAVNVRRAGDRSAHPDRPQPGRAREARRSAGRPLGGIVIAVALLAAAGYGWMQYAGAGSGSPTTAPAGALDAPKASPAAPQAARFRCDGRTQCSEMTSCEEAKFFLKSCAGAQLDADNNGIPCEQEWCTARLPR